MRNAVRDATLGMATSRSVRPAARRFVRHPSDALDASHHPRVFVASITGGDRPSRAARPARDPTHEARLGLASATARTHASCIEEPPCG